MMIMNAMNEAVSANHDSNHDGMVLFHRELLFVATKSYSPRHFGSRTDRRTNEKDGTADRR